MSELAHVHPIPTGAVCPHEECEYLRGHGSACCACGQTRHAIASDWSSYSFGHSGGHVGFLTACAHCGRVDRGHICGSPWTVEELAAAETFIRVHRAPLV